MSDFKLLSGEDEMTEVKQTRKPKINAVAITLRCFWRHAIH